MLKDRNVFVGNGFHFRFLDPREVRFLFPFDRGGALAAEPFQENARRTGKEEDLARVGASNVAATNRDPFGFEKLQRERDVAFRDATGGGVEYVSTTKHLGDDRAFLRAAFEEVVYQQLHREHTVSPRLFVKEIAAIDLAREHEMVETALFAYRVKERDGHATPKYGRYDDILVGHQVFAGVYDRDIAVKLSVVMAVHSG